MGSVQIEPRIIGRSPCKNQPVFASVELTKNLENAPVFTEQAEMEAT